jgi:hypothetical protein
MSTKNDTSRADDALSSGNNGAAAKAYGADCPEALQRDSIYWQVYVGGCVVYAALIALFLM